MSVSTEIHVINMPSNGRRQCAIALCTTLDTMFKPTTEALRVHIQAQSGSKAYTSTDVQHLQSLMQHLLPDTEAHRISSIVAVLYTLTVATTSQPQPFLRSRSPAVNQSVSSLTILLSSEDGKFDAAQVWHNWQLLLQAVGLNSCHICALLTPASKATLIRLQTAAIKPVASVKLQARHPLLLTVSSSTFTLLLCALTSRVFTLLSICPVHTCHTKWQHTLLKISTEQHQCNLTGAGKAP